jgi:hypothetical protein
MKDMQHLDPVIGDSIEDQIISVHTPPNTDVLIARDKRIGARMVAKTLASIAKLQLECQRPRLLVVVIGRMLASGREHGKPGGAGCRLQATPETRDRAA